MGSLSNYPSQVSVAIDRGGTFTDVVVFYPNGTERVFKLLSSDPQNYNDAPIEALRRILEEVGGRPIPRGTPLNLSGIKSLRMGTTVATNALLERQGQRTALFITRGFPDMLKIGTQSRPDMFAIKVQRAPVLYDKVVEVTERVTLHDSISYRRIDDKDIDLGLYNDSVVEGLSGERIRIVQRLDEQETRKSLQETYDEGFRSIAICFLHSYTFADHELTVAKMAEEIGFTQISVSSQLSPAIKMLNRANSAVTDAYLTPAIRTYLDSFTAGVDRQSLQSVNWRIMQSDGGLIHPSRVSGLRALLSGPAGGVIGYGSTCFVPEDPVPIIGFDMGGTSTDVSRYAGTLEHVFESITAGVTVQVPQLDINTVAAGGGSILTWNKGIMAVGPESAGSHPGPACYRKGGPATVTDANMVMGRILPDYFPHIFGKSRDQPLDAGASYQRIAELTAQINADKSLSYSVYEIAAGYISVANEAMCRPIRALTEARGHNTTDHYLAAFGGAGGQHACDVGQALRIKRVLLHKYSSVLSAYGMALADTVQEDRLPYSGVLSADSLNAIRPLFDSLRNKTVKSLYDMDPTVRETETRYFLNLRYDGSDTSLMVERDENDASFATAFVRKHHLEFGFTPTARDILIDDVRVRSIAKADVAKTVGLREMKQLKSFHCPVPKKSTPMFLRGQGLVGTPLFHLDDLSPGDQVHGPAVIIDKTQTIVVTPHAIATSLTTMLVIDLDVGQVASDTSASVDPVRLSVFANRFMGIAEQMGRAFQKTSVSTNIKERLDYSCAIFSADGGLVANAPHVPGMLGSMAFAVKGQIDHWKGDFVKGDVFVSNSPSYGGTHLPDLTVITPIFDDAGEKVLFWLASRGHHADIGGIVPGSMPADSKELWEEGAIINAMKVVENGVFREDRVIEAMVHKPASYPGCEGARSIQDNITDIKAAAAANHKGLMLINTLIEEYTLETVMVYMAAVQRAAESAVRDTLMKICKDKGKTLFQAVDRLDDGSKICLKITIDPNTGSADFDFTGTSAQAYGNWNASPSVLNSATIYCLRCLVNADIPMNQGCMIPINLIIPDNSLLLPDDNVAVAAGPGLTAQRLTDTILHALEVCAASNGCMANFTFGLPGADGFGYYETIAGGSGAGASWQGEDGVHCHMTNTRITDTEILERRYPVLMREFRIRLGSGGKGKFRGGHGVTRTLEFLVDMHVGILSERRVFAPYGMAGGDPAETGLNLWLKSNGRSVNVGGKASFKVKKGDKFQINTPGGGGYGTKMEEEEVEEPRKLVNGNKIVKDFVPLANGSLSTARFLQDTM